MTYRLIIVYAFVLFWTGNVCFAHSGRLDAAGGHKDKDGSYHLHKKPKTVVQPLDAVPDVSVPVGPASEKGSTNAVKQAAENVSTNADAYAWECVQIDLPAGSKESLFQKEYAKLIGGKTEHTVKTGRIDVETESEVFELDRQDKWKEGLGQALAYAQATGKKPVLVLISSSQGPKNMHKESHDKFDMALEICATNRVRLVILFPSKPRPAPKEKQQEPK